MVVVVFEIVVSDLNCENWIESRQPNRCVNGHLCNECVLIRLCLYMTMTTTLQRTLIQALRFNFACLNDIHIHVHTHTQAEGEREHTQHRSVLSKTSNECSVYGEIWLRLVVILKVNTQIIY